MLIAGGGHADIPLILAAKRNGFHVTTSGNRPQDLGHPHADAYVEADFSSPEAMLDVARRIGADAVCPCCNDFSALSCAYVAQEMGLPGHDPMDVALVIHHKDIFREFATANGFCVPRAMGAVDMEEGMRAVEAMGLPLIIKPVDLTGGKGVTTVREPGQTRPALEKAFAAGRAGRVVVEDFVEGSRHGMSAFIRDGRMVFYLADQEHYYLNPYLVSAASTPAQVPASVLDHIRLESERMAALLHLKTGIFHIQYILRGDEPVFLEICRRAPGDLYVTLVRHATGVDFAHWIVRAAAGLDCDGLEHVEPRINLTRHCVMAPRPGVLRDIVVHESVVGRIIDQMWWWRPGDEVRDVMTKKFGIVFVRFDSPHQMMELTPRLHELISVNME